MTEWRPVVGFDGYEVSDDGQVRSRRQVLKPVLNGGYLGVSLSVQGVVKRRNIHVLMLEAFVGPRPEGLVSRHINGDALDIRLENLAWGTQAENMQDRITHGTNSNLLKTHCPKNHRYTERNTLIRKNGSRACRTCDRERKETGNVLLPLEQ